MFRSRKSSKKRRERWETFDGIAMDDIYKSQVAEDIKTIVLNCLEGDYKLLAKLEDEETYLDGVAYDSLVEHGEGFALVSRARHIHSHLRMIDSVLDEISLRVKEKIKGACQRINYVASVCGLASLPPEVLSLVFSFIIQGSPSSNKPRSLISVRLSHVCRQFRYIITTNPRFWTTISTTPFTPELGLVNACLERSKGCPLEVQLNLYTTPSQDDDFQQALLSPRHVEYDNTFPALRPHIHRWRSVHLNFIDVRKFRGISGFWRALQDALFPMLETISVEGRSHEYAAFNAKLARTSSWNCPKLAAVILKNCVPNPLPNLAAVTTFDVNYFQLLNVVDMLKTLNEMSSIAISDLRIDITKLNPECSGIGHDQLLALSCVTIGTVKKFQLGFAAEHIADAGLPCVRNILSKMYLPNAENIVLKGSDQTRSSRESFPLDRLLSEISNRCPNITGCEITVRGGHSNYTSLPLHLPAKLENLRVVCTTCLTVSREHDEEKVESTPSNIRRITIGVECTPNLSTSSAIDWVRRLKERMQKYGGWDEFENLTVLKGVPVDNTGFRNLETVFELEEVIPREEVEEWCKSRYVFPKIVEEYKRHQRYRDYDGYDSWG